MSRPLIVLGIDGLDWDFVDQNRAALGSWPDWPVFAPLRSIFPPDSIPAWTTIFTGVKPADHGILESIDYLDKRPARVAEVAGEGLPHNTFWDRAGERGKRVAVVNPFLAYPSWDVRGAMVAGPVFVSGEVSATGIDLERVGPLPELGGIVTFPTERTIGPFVSSTLEATQDQADFGLRVLDEVKPDLFFLNILTVDRLQHFAWRFGDPGDPTYPGPTQHKGAVLASYRVTANIVTEYAKRGDVIVLSDHGHGRRCTRMVFVDEALRRAGLVKERSRGPRLLSRTYLLERAKRATLLAAYKLEKEELAYRVARRLPNRKALKRSDFSSDASASPARLSRIFGRNQFGGVDVLDDSPAMRERVKTVLSELVDPKTGRAVCAWVRDREDVVSGGEAGRYPPVLFKLVDGYGVDYGIYGSIFSPDTNHRRISGGHKDVGVLACSFAPRNGTPDTIEGMHDFVLASLER